MFKNEISTDELCPKSGLKHSVGHFQGIGIKIDFFFIFFCQKMFKNEISTDELCPKSGLKHSVGHFQGIGINI